VPVSYATIHRRLLAVATPARAASSSRFFKTGPGEYGEGDRFLGIDVPTLRKFSREFQGEPRTDLLRLLRSPWHEERALALLVLVRQYQRGDAQVRDAIHALYLANTRYVNNWDFVDCSAEHIVGPHLPKGRRVLLRRLAKSNVIWERRIAVLATFHYIKQGQFDDTLRLAAMLLEDEHDLMHKAVGWMLREIGNRDLAVEQVFLDEHAARMPRTMLRYAIERFPERLRQRYLRTPKAR
jgi:3-methyladenine DNA glycosylase AlkD